MKYLKKFVVCFYKIHFLYIKKPTQLSGFLFSNKNVDKVQYHQVNVVDGHKDTNPLSNVDNKGCPNCHNKCADKDPSHLKSALRVYKDTSPHLDDKDIHY